jgi:hypothetical protein
MVYEQQRGLARRYHPHRVGASQQSARSASGAALKATVRRRSADSFPELRYRVNARVELLSRGAFALVPLPGEPVVAARTTAFRILFLADGRVNRWRRSVRLLCSL